MTGNARAATTRLSPRRRPGTTRPAGRVSVPSLSSVRPDEGFSRPHSSRLLRPGAPFLHDFPPLVPVFLKVPPAPQTFFRASSPTCSPSFLRADPVFLGAGRNARRSVARIRSSSRRFFDRKPLCRSTFSLSPRLFSTLPGRCALPSPKKNFLARRPPRTQASFCGHFFTIP